MIGGLPKLRTVNVEGPYNVKGRQHYSEPRANLHLPSGHRCRGAGVRAENPDEPGAARLPSTGDGRRRRATDVVLQAVARERRQLRRRDSRGRRAHSVEPLVPLQDGEGSCRRSGGYVARGQRYRAGFAPVVLPLEQHPGSETAGSRRGRAPPRTRRPGHASAPDDRGRARRCAGQQFRRGNGCSCGTSKRRSPPTC